MPPMMITGVIIGRVARRIARPSSSQGRARVDRVAVAPRVDVDRGHLVRPINTPGTTPARNRPPIDTDISPPQTIIRMRGRDDHAHDAGAGGDRDREAGAVALLLHLRDQQRADPGSIGGRAAGDAGEEHRDQHVDLAEPARQVPDHGARETDQPVGDAGGVHQVGGEEEERARPAARRRCSCGTSPAAAGSGVSRGSSRKTGRQASASAKATGMRRMIRVRNEPNRIRATRPGVMRRAPRTRRRSAAMPSAEEKPAS